MYLLLKNHFTTYGPMQAAVRQFEKPTFRPAATGQKRIDEPGKKGTKHNPRKRPQIMKSDKIKKQLNFMF